MEVGMLHAFLKGSYIVRRSVDRQTVCFGAFLGFSSLFNMLFLLKVTVASYAA